MQVERVSLAQDRFNALFENMVEGIVLQNELGQITQTNRAAREILGLPDFQLVGKTFFDEQWRAVREDLSELPADEYPSALALKTGRVQSNQIVGLYRQNGTLTWMLVTAVPLFERGCLKPSQVTVSFHDITEQIRAKKEIKRREEDVSRIINSLPALIGYWDRNLLNVHANDVYSEYFGKSPAEIRGKHIRDVLGDDLYKKNHRFIEGALNGVKQVFEREIPLPAGGRKFTLANYLPDIRDGIVHGFFVIVSDITDLKTIEKEKHEIAGKLTSSAKMTALGEMAGGMAHEINSPLSTILLGAELIREQLESPSLDRVEIEKALIQIENTSQRIARIVRGLRAFARDGAQDKLQKARVSTLVEETLAFCAERFRSRGVNLVLHSIPDSITLDCRPIQISQVFLNLLNNAYDAIEKLDEKWIDLSVRESLGRIEIAVMDSGLGIPEAIQDKMMQPFFTTKEIGKGTGLGLSISKGIIESHDGKLFYDRSSVNTRFIVSLPKR